MNRLDETSYFIYVVHCDNDTFYTGITTDIVRRLREHRSQTGACAKYTRVHHVEELLGLWSAPNRSVASRLEFRIKQLSRKQKEQLLANPYKVDSLVDNCKAIDAHKQKLFWDEAINQE